MKASSFALFLLIQVVLIQASFAQDDPPKVDKEKDQNVNGIIMQGNLLRSFDLVEAETEGTYLLLDEYVRSRVDWSKTGEEGYTELGNYHLDLDQFVFLEDGKQMGVAKQRVASFTVVMDGKPARFTSTSLLSNDTFEGKTSYLQELFYNSANSASLLQYWYVNVVPPSYNMALNTGNKNTVLRRRSQFVALVNDKYYVNFKLKKKLIKELFSEDSAALLQFVKANNLSDSEADLIRFFEEANRL
ncbi:MAG: hypothetical protein ACI8QD_002635 [Cyclobacteriaceae bacterium]|jgi:hypothetical protein